MKDVLPLSMNNERLLLLKIGLNWGSEVCLYRFQLL